MGGLLNSPAGVCCWLRLSIYNHRWCPHYQPRCTNSAFIFSCGYSNFIEQITPSLLWLMLFLLCRLLPAHGRSWRYASHSVQCGSYYSLTCCKCLSNGEAICILMVHFLFPVLWKSCLGLVGCPCSIPHQSTRKKVTQFLKGLWKDSHPFVALSFKKQ